MTSVLVGLLRHPVGGERPAHRAGGRLGYKALFSVLRVQALPDVKLALRLRERRHCLIRPRHAWKRCCVEAPKPAVTLFKQRLLVVKVDTGRTRVKRQSSVVAGLGKHTGPAVMC